MRKCIHLEALLVYMYDDITLGVFMEMPPFIMVSFRIATHTEITTLLHGCYNLVTL